MPGDLPPYVKAALAAMLDGVSRRALGERAANLSTAYRDGAGSATAIAGGEDALAYLVTRMPATYAAITAAFGALAQAAPDFSPRRVVDVGAGPGTASIAAAETWQDIASVALIEANRTFANTASRLTAAAPHAALAGAAVTLGDAARLGRPLPDGDLVVAGYVLAELSDAAQAALVTAMWAATHGALVLVEPGTPDGFRRIRAARALLIGAGASIAAPCPHTAACPIMEPDWCHFAARLARSRDHRLAKGADAPFEDEKFAYVAAVRPAVATAAYGARILARPKATKAGISLKLCTADGTIAVSTVARREADAYRRLRHAAWGDALR